MEQEGTSSLRGLVVDDDPVMRSFLAELLRELGIDASVVAGQTEAEDLLKAVDFDLLLLDLRFADALLGQIRRSRLRRPRAIAICSVPAERPDRFWEALGAQAFLPKPIERSALVAFLTDALEWRRVGVEAAGPCVLLVGGGSWVQEVTSAVLRMGGRVHVSPSAKKLAEKRRLVKPSLVVIGPPLSGNDLFMPCAELQQEAEERPIVLAAMSAADERLREDLLGIGVARVHPIPAAMRSLVEDAAHLAGISRRAVPRAPLSSTVLVHAADAPIAALACDISEGGLGVRDLKGEVPAQVDLEIGLPGDERLIRVPAAVAWRSQQADGRARMGMRFLRIAANDVERIRRFVSQPRLTVVPSPAPTAEGSAPAKSPAKTVIIEAAPDGRLALSFADEEAFRAEWESTLKTRGVYAKIAVRPAMRSPVEIVVSLVKEKREALLQGEVVFLGPDGVAIQLSPFDADLWKKAPVREAPPAPPPAAAPQPPVAPPAVTAPTPAPIEAFTAELSDSLREAELDRFGPAEPRLGARASWLRILRSLQVREANGTLSIEKKGETIRFLFRKGRVADTRAEPPREEETLFRIARQRKLVSSETLASMPGKPSPAEEVDLLKTKARVKASDVESIRRTQMLERGARVLSWSGAKARFDPAGEWAPPGSASASCSSIALHAVHHGFSSSGEEMSELMRAVMDMTVRKAPDTAFDPEKAGFNPKETKLWDFASSGEHSVRQLLKIAPLAGYLTSRYLAVLLRMGMLVLHEPKRAAKADPIEELKHRAADLKGKDPFGKLGLTWMAAAPQVEAAFESLRRDLAPDLASSGGRVTLAREILSILEGAWKLLMTDADRRAERAKLVDDPNRVLSAAEFLAEKADLLRMRGDRAGAVASIQMAHDLAPTHPQCRKIALELGVLKA